MHFYIYLLALGCVVNGATISRTEDSYQNLPLDSDQDIKENLIQDEDVGDIVGLLPPKPDAKDYFPQQPDYFRESSYDIDSVEKTMKLKKTQTKENPLTSEDKLAMRDIAVAFEKLLGEALAGADNTDPQKPVIVMADNGKAAVDDKINERQEENVESTTLPSGETDTFTTDDSSVTDEAREDEESALMSFFSSLWSAVQESVGLAARMITSLGRRDDSSAEPTSVPETTPVTDVSTTASSAVSSAGPIAAFEEPSSHLSLPAHEFDNRRDIDSLLYGRGIA